MTTDSKAKSNKEVARGVVYFWRKNLIQVVQWEQLESAIESALATTQSQLAGEVLAAIGTMREREGSIEDLVYNDGVEQSLVAVRGLFARLGVKVE